MYLENYMALLACVLSPDLTTDEAIGILVDKSFRNKKGNGKNNKYEVTDVTTNKNYILSYQETLETLDICEANKLYYILRQKKPYKGRYRVKKVS